MSRSRDLPPLMALRAFEAAARHRNFARAAAELGVSAGAVSHQVKLMEHWVGRPLFERRANGVFVTSAGRELGAEAGALMDRLAQAAQRSRERRRSGPVTIVSQFSLAAKWLAPRLGRMRAQWPELDLRLNAVPQEVDPANYDGDLFIYFSPGFAAGFVHDPVAESSFAVVAAPALAAGLPTPPRPADLLGQPLIDTVPAIVRWGYDWGRWFAAAGVSAESPACALRFGVFHLAIEACVAGGGFALAPEIMTDWDVAQGRLVRPFDVALPLQHVYHLIVAEEKLARPEVRQVRDWLLDGARV